MEKNNEVKELRIKEEDRNVETDDNIKREIVTEDIKNKVEKKIKKKIQKKKRKILKEIISKEK